MASFGAVRSVLRTTPAARKAATCLASGAKAARSPFRSAAKKHLSNRPFWFTSQMSFCVESMLPYHTATASALMTSMLSATGGSYGLLTDACNDDL